MVSSYLSGLLIAYLFGNALNFLIVALRTTFPSSPETSRPDPVFQRPCQQGSPSLQYDFCDHTLPLETRISSLLSLLTPEEKISLLGNTASSVPRLALPPYQWWSEALHGVASYGCCPPHKVVSTSFPQVCSLGVSFNASLYAAIGDAIGSEAVHHFWHTGDMPGLTYWAPNVNIFRDPRWGRGQEVPGEDPYLNGEYASNLIPALQFGKNTHRPRVAAACKHFYAYSMETGRDTFNAVIVDARDLEDSYLPAFFKCVESGVMGIMCSYNAVDGVPSCAHGDMLTRVLRDQLGFTGYITGDCGAVENIYSAHHFAATPKEAVQVALEAGVDVDCGNWIQEHGMEALDSGVLAIEHVDRAVTNLLRVQFRLGYFDPAPPPEEEVSHISAQLHNDLSLDAARQSIVLLKNVLVSERPCLPLSKEQHKVVALFGPNANATTTMQGNYAGIAPFLISPKQGLEDFGIEVIYEKGCNISSLDVHFDAHKCEAAKTDAVVLVVGLDQTVEKEGLDRISLALPATQHKLITHVCACAAHPVILVVMAGGPVDLTPYKDNDAIGAILYVGYPGQSGGTAIAEALYGKFSPSGRLSTTIYPADFGHQVSLEDMRMRPDSNDGFPGRTYRFYTGKVVYPFGFGMSYTRFDYDITLEDTSVSVQVHNEGPMDGAHSVLLFHAGPEAGSDGNPIKSLVGFDKIFLKVGEYGTVQFSAESQIASSHGMHRFYIGQAEDRFADIAGQAQSASVE